MRPHRLVNHATSLLILAAFLLLAAGSSDTDTKSPSTRTSSAATGVQRIPRSVPERADYYLLSVKKDGDHLRTLHKRVSSSGDGYSLTRIDCASMRYQDLGYGEGSESAIRMYSDTRWTEVVPGSSKSDLVRFVCARR